MIILNKIKNIKTAIVCTFTLTTLFWVVFVLYTRHTALYEGPIFQYILKPFLIGMTILPILGGLLGIQKSQLWGGWKSAIGKSLITLSCGLISWGCGMIIWNYYLFFTNTQVPYPSLADFFFILIWILWTHSMVQISKATGAKYGFRKIGGKTLALILAIAVVLLSYYLLFKIARQGQLDLTGSLLSNLLAFLYPLGDISILLTSVLVLGLSYKFLGGQYRMPVLILFAGFILNYVADIIFVFTTTQGTYFNGHISDFLYVVMLFILSMGISKMDPAILQNNKKI